MTTQNQTRNKITGLLLMILLSVATITSQGTDEPQVQKNATLLSVTEASLLGQIEASLQSPADHLKSFAVFVHLYINDQGEIVILEAYSPSSELKQWVTNQLTNSAFRLKPGECRQHIEFTVSFRSI